MEYGDIFLIVIEIAFAIGLYLLSDYSLKVPNSKWRVCYVVPFVFTMLMVGVFGVEISMVGVYAGAVIMLAGFLNDALAIRKVSSVLAVVTTIISFVVCTNYSGYRAPDYLADFENGFAKLKRF